MIELAVNLVALAVAAYAGAFLLVVAGLAIIGVFFAVAWIVTVLGCEIGNAVLALRRPRPRPTDPRAVSPRGLARRPYTGPPAPLQ
jgi:hypothetical protein